MSDDFVFENIDCLVLRSNLQATMLRLFENSEFPIEDFQEQLNRKIGESESSFSKFLTNQTVYKQAFIGLSEKYEFPQGRVRECKNLLELAALQYMTLAHVKDLRPQMREIDRRLTKINKQIELLSFHMKSINDFKASLDLIIGPGSSDLLIKTEKNLRNVFQLKSRLRAGQFGTMTQLGSNTKVGNLGLLPFIQISYFLWHTELNRKLEQKYDGRSGRKQFFAFLQDCMKVIHPALSYERLDYALKDAQKSKKVSELVLKNL